jgi:hypothetical protein
VGFAKCSFVEIEISPEGDPEGLFVLIFAIDIWASSVFELRGGKSFGLRMELENLRNPDLRFNDAFSDEVRRELGVLKRRNFLLVAAI